MHLNKAPEAIIHWSTLSRSLTRRELDGRKSDAPSAIPSQTMAEVADSYGALATIFNDYENFTPQHEMLKYIPPGIRKVPFEANSDEWKDLVNHCYDIEPTNLLRKNIIRDGDWIKQTWNSIRGVMHEISKY